MLFPAEKKTRSIPTPNSHFDTVHEHQRGTDPSVLVSRMHWYDSPIFFGIHCIDPSVSFENAFHTGSKYDVAVCTASLSFP
jgi:hypothetical protein